MAMAGKVKQYTAAAMLQISSEELQQYEAIFGANFETPTIRFGFTMCKICKYQKVLTNLVKREKEAFSEVHPAILHGAEFPIPHDFLSPGKAYVCTVHTVSRFADQQLTVVDVAPKLIMAGGILIGHVGLIPLWENGNHLLPQKKRYISLDTDYYVDPSEKKRIPYIEKRNSQWHMHLLFADEHLQFGDSIICIAKEK